MTYIGKRIKVGFAIDGANPALNIHTSQVTGLGFLKTGKLQLIIPAAKEFKLLDRGSRLLKNKGKLTMRRQENTEKVFLDVFQLCKPQM